MTKQVTSFCELSVNNYFSSVIGLCLARNVIASAAKQSLLGMIIIRLDLAYYRPL